MQGSAARRDYTRLWRSRTKLIANSTTAPTRQMWMAGPTATTPVKPTIQMISRMKAIAKAEFFIVVSLPEEVRATRTGSGCNGYSTAPVYT